VRDDKQRTTALHLARNIPVIALICCMISLWAALSSNAKVLGSSNATVPESSNTVVALDNATLSNETITKLANETIIPLTNNLSQSLAAINQSATNQARLNEEARKNATEEIAQSLAAINQSATNQARLNEEARKNVTESVSQRNVIIQQVVRDLPTNLSVMVGLLIFAVIPAPLIFDMYLRRNKGGEKPNFYRALMTFGVIIVVGIVVVYLIALINVNILTENPNVNALIDVLKNLSTIVGTALAAIVAFYFGTRSAQGQGRGGGGGGQNATSNATTTGGATSGTTNTTSTTEQGAPLR
jgi:hypothetical protein